MQRMNRRLFAVSVLLLSLAFVLASLLTVNLSPVYAATICTLTVRNMA